MIIPLRTWIAIVLLLYAPLAYSGDISRWYSGACSSPYDPRHDKKLWPALCTKLQSESSSLYSLTEPVFGHHWQSKNNEILTANRIYAGFHASSYLSLHLKYFHSYSWQDSLPQKLPQERWESAFLQLGHPILHELSAAIGLLDLPFGLDYNLLSEALRAHKNRAYWHQYVWGTKLSWIRHDRTLIELGLSQADLPKSRWHFTGPWSLRVSKDLPALEGTKLLLSYSRDENEFQRIGFATLNTSRNGVTSFEWVRNIPLDEPGLHFSQVFRFNHLSPWHNNRRWKFEYEYERYTMWLLAFGSDFLISKYFQLNLELAYQGRESSHIPSHWLLGGGFKLSL